MSSINPTTSNTLLSYSLNTMPDPLQASPAEGNTVYGTLSFVVSNGSSDAIVVTQLQFTLPVGTLAQQLTNDASAVLYASSPSGQWIISMTTTGVFTALPQSGQPITVTTDGIVFQFFNIPVNQQVGTVAIGVNETASNSTVSSQVRSASFNVAKFPYGFFFGNFTAQVPLVQDGQTVTLNWQGSDQATYTMYWGSQSSDVSEVRTWTSPALTSDTSFLLRASVVSQGETVTRDLSTTVIVANPELQATSLVVSGVTSLNTAALSGTLNVAGATTLAGVSAAGLSVSGTSTVGNLSASGLGVSGSTTLGGLNASSLGVSGGATLGNTTINGSLSANGASLGSTNINGSFTAKSGPVSMLGTGTLVASGTTVNLICIRKCVYYKYLVLCIGRNCWIIRYCVDCNNE
jgi:filamentous hemagglutinin family protein